MRGSPPSTEHKLRLLVVSNLYPPVAMGGYERLCSDVVLGLKARGHQVAVLTAADPKTPDVELGVLRLLKVRPDFHYEEVRHHVSIGRNRFEVERHNSRVFDSVADDFKPDAVVFFSGRFLGGALVARAEAKYPVVYRLADEWLAWMLPRHRRQRPLRSRIYEELLNLLGMPAHRAVGRHLVFCSESLKEDYITWGASVDESVVIYPGVPSDLFYLRPQGLVSRHPSSPFRVLYSGRISSEKGILSLIDALALVRQKPGFKETILTVMGSVQSQTYLQAVRERIVKCDLGKAVRFLPSRPRERVAEVYADNDVLVFPSEGKEPFGLTVVEGMLTGVPVIASNSGGPAEVVKDMWNGFSFQAGDATQLAEKLIWVLANPGAAAAIGRRASAYAKDQYGLDRYVDAIEDQIRSAASA